MVSQNDLLSPVSCANFSVITFIGYPPFISRALESVTCDNTVVVLYVLGDVIPFVGDVIRTQNHHGDTLFVYNKPYPQLETQTTSWKENEVRPDRYKYKCVDATCSTYKLRHQYHQSPSVLLMLDTLKVIENILLQYCDFSSLTNCRFSSITGSMAILTSQGFSYNSLNIYKANGLTSVDLLGYIDHKNATLMQAFWYSSLSEVPIKPNNICPQIGTEVSTETVVSVFVGGAQIQGIVYLLIIFLVLCMLFAEGVIFAIKRHKYKGKFKVHFNTICAVGCLDIIISSTLIIPPPFSCIPTATRDIVDFTFFVVIGYSVFLTDVRRLLRFLLPGVLYGIKIVIMIWALRESCSFSPPCYRYYAITFITIILFLTLTRYKTEASILKCTAASLLMSLGVEIVLLKVPGIPVACVIALFSCRVVLLTAGMCVYFRYRTDRFIVDEIASFDNLLYTLKCNQQTDVTSTTTKRRLSGRYSSDERAIGEDTEFCTCNQTNGDTYNILNSNSCPSNYPESCIEMLTEPSGISSTHALQTASYDECISKSCLDDGESSSSVRYKYAESPQLFWDNEHDLNSSLTNIKVIYENIYDQGSPPLRIKMCTKTPDSDDSNHLSDVVSLDVDESEIIYPRDSIVYRYRCSTLSDITEVDNENPASVLTTTKVESQEYADQSIKLHFDDDLSLPQTGTSSIASSDRTTSDAVKPQLNCCIPTIPEAWPVLGPSFVGKDAKYRPSNFALVTSESITDDIVLLKFEN